MSKIDGLILVRERLDALRRFARRFLRERPIGHALILPRAARARRVQLHSIPALRIVDLLARENGVQFGANAIVWLVRKRTLKQGLGLLWPAIPAPSRQCPKRHVPITNDWAPQPRMHEWPALAGKPAELLKNEIEVIVVRPLGSHSQFSRRSRCHLIEWDVLLGNRDDAIDAL